MKPRILKKGRAAQLSYDLPHRVCAAQVYPVPAPNGSAIIVYGHDSGLTILWRGGRSIRPTKKTSAERTQANGQADAVMIIDSDDEEPNELPEEVEYDTDEAELDPSEPYLPIIQHVDVSLNVGVLHMAFPPVPFETTPNGAECRPEIVSKKIVIAAACSDHSIRVVTLPLAPPSHEQTTRAIPDKQRRWGEQILTLPSHATHQSIASNIAITWTSRTPFKYRTSHKANDDEDSDEEDITTEQVFPQVEPGQWDFLVASHSPETTGVVHFSRVQVQANNKLNFDFTTPTQTLYLSSPALGVSFNPSLFPTEQHAQLLITESGGYVRIYDPLIFTRAQRFRTSKSSTDGKRGIYLTAFASPFKTEKTVSPIAGKRKAIIASAWVSHGHAIITLLEDGEWGVWSLHNAEQSRNSRTRGSAGGTSSFALKGFIGTTASSTSAQPTDRKQRGSRGLAPMTPTTRKTRQDKLFSGSSNSGATGPARGGILVSNSAKRSGEEQVLLWYSNEVYAIPSFQTLWNRPAGSLHGTSVTRVEDIDSFNERITGAQYLPPSTKRANTQPDLLITAETRLLIQSIGHRPEVERAMHIYNQEEEDAMDLDGQNQNMSERLDQHMLSQSMLDFEGVDRFLEGMGNSGVVAAAPEGPAGIRRVGFAA